MSRNKMRLAEILRRAHLTKETRNEALALLYLEQIYKLFRASDSQKVVLYFPENEEVYAQLVRLALEWKFEISRPFLGRLRRKISAKRK